MGSRKLQLVVAWCGGPAMTVLTLGGMVGIAGIVPVPGPEMSAEQIAQFLLDHAMGLRIGLMVTLLGCAVWFPWGMQVVHQTDVPGRSAPIVKYSMIATFVGQAIFVVLGFIIMGLAVFRPGDTLPEITRTLWEAAWFSELLVWAVAVVWNIVIAVAIFRDDRPVPAYPRWAGYLAIWAAVLYCPASLIVFFKTGPFAFNGMFALYIPFGVFYTWTAIMTVLMIKAINREAAAEGDQPDPTQAPSAWDIVSTDKQAVSL